MKSSQGCSRPGQAPCSMSVHWAPSHPFMPGSGLLRATLMVGAMSLALGGGSLAADTGPEATAPAQPTVAPAPPMPTPVRVVCLAEKEESFLRDPKDRAGLSLLRALAGISELLGGKGDVSKVSAMLKAEYPPVGGWHYLPIGTGFVVDAERLHVVTNWHVALACPRDQQSKMQIGIIEGVGNEIEPVLAELIEGRRARNEKGEEVREKINVHALCRNRDRSCTADSATNVEFFAPDLAVLRLQRKARAAPMTLAPQLPIDTRMDLQLAGFPQVTMRLAQGAGSPRTQAVTPTLTPARFSSSFTRDNVRPGLAQKDIVSADLMMLAAQVHAGNSGGPVLADGQVVGVVTSTVRLKNSGQSVAESADVKTAGRDDDTVIPSGYALAVKAVEVVKLLEWLNIKPVSAAQAAAPVSPPPVDPSGGEQVPPQSAPWWTVQQNQLWAALLISVLLAGGAFAVIARRQRAAPIDGTVLTNDKALLTADTIGVGVVDVKLDAPQPLQKPEMLPMAVELRGSHGPLNGMAYPLPTPNAGMALVVGRDPQTCQVVFPNGNDMVSRMHCCFVWNPQNRTLMVEDLGSTHGTFVNGRPLDKKVKTKLNDGDTVDLGGVTTNRFSVHFG